MDRVLSDGVLLTRKERGKHRGLVQSGRVSDYPGSAVYDPGAIATVTLRGCRGGVGTFDYPVVTASGGTSSVGTNDTWHGVFELGGGIDIRLTRLFSVRVECRDFVTGKGLDGVPGRHHIAPAAGIAAHF